MLPLPNFSMSSLLNLKNSIFVLVLALVLWIGYALFFAADDASLSALDVKVITEASRDTQEFLSTLQQLRNIEFKQQIFNDPRFQSFVDHRRPIIAEPVGRTNPFAPIGQQ